MRRLTCFPLALCVLGVFFVAPLVARADDPPSKMLAFFGSYSKPGSQGITVCELDLSSGQLKPLSSSDAVRNPSFLALHPSGLYLYAVGEVGSVNGTPGGAVAAFRVGGPTGKLTFLNQQSSRGGGPCYVAVDATGKNALVANYGGGSIASLPIDGYGKLAEASAFIQHEGSSVNESRQKAPHAHSILPSPDNRFVMAADLGCDKLFVYRFDANAGSLTPHEPAYAELKPGAGPRHFDFHPNGQFVYVINELDLTVTAFRYDADAGRLEEIHTLSTLPGEIQPGYSCAQIRVHPSGKFLYGSNRGHDTIAIFSIDPESGKLTAEGHEPTQGKTPRNFNIDPTGQFLIACNQNSDNVVVFKIDPENGKLSATGTPLQLVAPVCVQFLVRGS